MDRTTVQRMGACQGNRLWIKRDDLLPDCFGGNKYRKALIFFRQIDSGGYDTVVSYGTKHSNHCRIIANLAARRGLACVLIGPESDEEETANSRMTKLFGAETITVPIREVHQTIEDKLKALRKAGRRPFFIEGGGHGDLGTAAYVDCYEEIAAWSEENGIRFDYIFFASGTGTTQAGLVCGSLLRADDVKIVGISIARRNPRGRQVVVDSVNSYLSSVGAAIPASQVEDAVVFLDDYVADGYGKDNEAIRDTIRRVLIQNGVPLDLTYTGKAFYGMERYLSTREIRDRNILFLHTGGTPLFFDDFQKLVDL